MHKAEFHRICTLVQTPNIGTFAHTHLTWARHVRVKGSKADPRTYAAVSVAYIPWARVGDFLKGEEARTDAPCKFVCQGTPTNEKGKLMFPRWNSYSAIFRFVCNMHSDCYTACYNVTLSCQISSLLYMTHTVTTCCGPHPTGIIVNMDQMTMHRTYQWLQMTCTRRKESWTPKANTFQTERVTQVHGHPQGCEDRGSEGDANVDLSSSDCTYTLLWQK